MERTTELFSTAPAGAPPETPGMVAAVAEVTPEAPARPPRFMSIHELWLCAQDLSEVGSGTVLVRDESGELKLTATSKIPSDKLAEFHDAIASGRVYVLWGYRNKKFDELGPDWHLDVRPVPPAASTPVVPNNATEAEHLEKPVVITNTAQP